MVYGELIDAAKGIGILVLFVAILLLVLNSIGTMVSGAANTSVQAGITALGSTSGLISWLPIIVTVIVASIVLFIVIRAFNIGGGGSSGNY